MEEDVAEISKPIKDNSKSRRFGRKGSDTRAPPVLLLPPIPESLNTSATLSNFGRIVRHIRSKSTLAPQATEATFAAVDAALSAKTPRKLRIPFRRTKSTISNPELQSDPNPTSIIELPNSQFSNPFPYLNAGANPRQSVASPTESGYPSAVETDIERAQWTIAKPRLSPMEYARTVLIRSALYRRESATASAPAELTKLWFWTPGWETFLIIPREPVLARKDSATSELPAYADMIDTQKNIDTTLLPSSKRGQPEVNRNSLLSCPRLSLNLGSIAMQLPSMLQLINFDGIHSFRSPSNSTVSTFQSTSESYTHVPANIATGNASGQGSREESSENHMLTLLAEGVDNYPTCQPGTASVAPSVIDPDGPAEPDGEANHGNSDTATRSTNTQFEDESNFSNSEVQQAEPPPMALGNHAVQGSPAESCSSIDIAALAVPQTFGLDQQHPTDLAFAHQPPRRRIGHRVVGGQLVTAVSTSRVPQLVAGEMRSAVMSMHAHSENFELPDVSDEERELRPPPLFVHRQRRRSEGRSCLRQRDTTRRNLFSSNDGEDDVDGLLRHLGDSNGDDGLLSPVSPEDEEGLSPWSPFYYSDNNHILRVTPSIRSQSSAPNLATPTSSARRLAISPLRTRTHREQRGDEEHSGFSPRPRQMASTHLPLPDSPTLPAVGPQVRIKQGLFGLSNDALIGARLGGPGRLPLPQKSSPTRRTVKEPNSGRSGAGKRQGRDKPYPLTPRKLRKPRPASKKPSDCDSSSFALHKAASHGAFTLLPKLSVSRRRSGTVAQQANEEQQD